MKVNFSWSRRKLNCHGSGNTFSMSNGNKFAMVRQCKLPWSSNAIFLKFWFFFSFYHGSKTSHGPTGRFAMALKSLNFTNECNTCYGDRKTQSRQYLEKIIISDIAIKGKLFVLSMKFFTIICSHHIADLPKRNCFIRDDGKK